MNEAVDWKVWQMINDQIQSLADALDRADLPGILEIFTDDAVWDYAPGGVRQGKQAIAAFFTERLNLMAQSSHFVGPPVVRSDPTGGGFVSTSYLIANHIMRDGKTYTGYGRYLDCFQPNSGSLLISRRKIVAIWCKAGRRKCISCNGSNNERCQASR